MLYTSYSKFFLNPLTRSLLNLPFVKIDIDIVPFQKYQKIPRLISPSTDFCIFNFTPPKILGHPLK
jgi:hypothetical protein